jgi:signal-transduction protein with cAMP-binding, CBS, and nucleotidyltransferase domain
MGAFVGCTIDDLIRETVSEMDENQTVQAAAELMSLQNTGSLVVTRDGEVVGLFTERDLLRRVVGQGLDPTQARIGAVCTRHLVTISHHSPCAEAIQKMQANRCRRLLVYHGQSFLGMVDLRDVAQALADQGKTKDILVNILGATTLGVAIAVIAMLIYQLPNVLQLAHNISGQ